MLMRVENLAILTQEVSNAVKTIRELFHNLFICNYHGDFQMTLASLEFGCNLVMYPLLLDFSFRMQGFPRRGLQDLRSRNTAGEFIRERLPKEG